VIDTLTVIVRFVGAAVFWVAWIAGAVGGARGLRHARGPASGLARTMRALGAYTVVAGPYLVVCTLLWRPLPLHLGAGARGVALLVGTVVGGCGAWLYLWGRRTLADMYNVSSAFGSELFGDHRLVTAGPYRIVRHPMYVGLVAAAVGGLLVYRVWALIFVIACLPGAWLKARREDRLLAVRFGPEFEEYRAAVPGWFPRAGRSREASRRSSRRRMPA
jgi:protein-S-isoprenylcysteine O-methyltransferase Ste14